MVTSPSLMVLLRVEAGAADSHQRKACDRVLSQFPVQQEQVVPPGLRPFEHQALHGPVRIVFRPTSNCVDLFHQRLGIPVLQGILLVNQNYILEDNTRFTGVYDDNSRYIPVVLLILKNC